MVEKVKLRFGREKNDAFMNKWLLCYRIFYVQLTDGTLQIQPAVLQVLNLLSNKKYNRILWNQSVQGIFRWIAEDVQEQIGNTAEALLQQKLKKKWLGITVMRLDNAAYQKNAGYSLGIRPLLYNCTYLFMQLIGWQWKGFIIFCLSPVQGGLVTHIKVQCAAMYNIGIP